MKLYLDDERNPKSDGWVVVRTVSEAIAYMLGGDVVELSVDHDLGEDQPNGYTLLEWIEKEVAYHGLIPPAIINVHSANPGVAIKMAQAVESIARLALDNK